MTLANWLAMAAVALALLGVLLFLEVIRPFHNLSIDGPLALLSWGIGGAPFPGYSVAERQIVYTQCRQSFRERDAFTGCFVGLVADRP